MRIIISFQKLNQILSFCEAHQPASSLFPPTFSRSTSASASTDPADLWGLRASHSVPPFQSSPRSPSPVSPSPSGTNYSAALQTAVRMPIVKREDRKYVWKFSSFTTPSPQQTLINLVVLFIISFSISCFANKFMRSSFMKNRKNFFRTISLILMISVLTQNFCSGGRWRISLTYTESHSVTSRW